MLAPDARGASFHHKFLDLTDGSLPTSSVAHSVECDDLAVLIYLVRRTLARVAGDGARIVTEAIICPAFAVRSICASYAADADG